MADIELIVKIPEEKYNKFMYSDDVDEEELVEAFEYLMNGTPLPKGHGRIGDLDALEIEMVNGIKAGNYEEGYEKFAHINNMDDCVDCVRYADTIIEADKESEE